MPLAPVLPPAPVLVPHHRAPQHSRRPRCHSGLLERPQLPTRVSPTIDDPGTPHLASAPSARQPFAPNQYHRSLHQLPLATSMQSATSEPSAPPPHPPRHRLVPTAPNHQTPHRTAPHRTSQPASQPASDLLAPAVLNCLFQPPDTPPESAATPFLCSENPTPPHETSGMVR